MIPVIAGASYEVLKAAAGKPWMAWASRPGIWLQRITTRQPDESQIEVAVASLLAALTDDELRQTFLHHDAMQVKAYRQVIDAVATTGSLRAGLTLETATDLLLTVAGDGTYFLLRTERGWSEEQVTEWMSQALPRLLLDESTRKART